MTPSRPRSRALRLLTALAVAGGTVVVAPAAQAAPFAYDWRVIDPAPSTVWDDIAMSGDGARAYALSGDGAYRSDDGGATWAGMGTGTRTEDLSSASMATDADGSVVLIGGYARLFQPGAVDTVLLSADGGTSFRPVTVLRSADSVAVDADGSVMVVSDESSGGIVVSRDSGANWAPAGLRGRWGSLATSADGSRIVATAYGTPGPRIVRSVDGGANWTSIEPAGAAAFDWSSISSSADGLTLAAVQNLGNSAVVTIPTDGGGSWTQHQSSTDVASVDVSADGSRIATAGANGVTVLTSSGSSISAAPLDGHGALVTGSDDAGRFVAAPYSGRLTLGTATPSIPVITAQPTAATVADGSTASFTAAASGFPEPTVRWQRSGTSGWSDVPGATSTTLTVTASSTTVGSYRAVFSNSAGSASSAPAELRLTAPPAPPTVDEAAFRVQAFVGEPFTWTVPITSAGPTRADIRGALPAWLAFDDGGKVLSGTPTATGEALVDVRVWNQHAEIVRTLRIEVVERASVVGFASGPTVGDRLADGVDVVVTGRNLSRPAGWTLDMHSTPTRIGSGTADALGSFRGTVRLPVSTPAGAHRLLLTSTGAAGGAVTAQMWFAVDAAGTITAVSSTGPVALPPASRTTGGLARTGAELPVAGLAGLAGLLLAGAGVALVAARRRRTV